MRSTPKVLKTFCTSAEAAKLLGVSLRTVQLWAEAGVLEAWKTGGGHRRINRTSVERLLHSPKGHRVRKVGTAGSSDQAASTQPAPPSFNILVAEDNAILRKLYEVNLSRWPMRPRVTTAGDGYEALIIMGHSKPDLLVLDLNMPDIDGFRMLQTIRSTPELANTAVIVVSGLDAAEIKSRGGVPEGIPILCKPIPFPELQALAQKLVPQPI
ncbi:MAG: response regulator [Burkholderiales bacterium]